VIDSLPLMCRYFFKQISPFWLDNRDVQGRNEVRWPLERNKFGAPMFEPEVFRKQMYCFEEKSFWHCCDFLPPRSDSAPRELSPPSWHLWCYAIKIGKMSENKQIANVMNFYSMNICNFRTQYHMDFAHTANKSYWRHFKFLREVFVTSNPAP